jgi:hypothetical protein
MRTSLVLILIVLLMLIPPLFTVPFSAAQPTPTLTITPTSQPAPPVLIYPPDGAVLTRSITVQELTYLSTGAISYVTLTGHDFIARWCMGVLTECSPEYFENENVLLPDGFYRWSVFTTKPLGSANSEIGYFRIETDLTTDLPPMLTATPKPTRSPATPEKRQ